MENFSAQIKIYLTSIFLFLSSCLYSLIASAEEAKKPLLDGIFNASIFNYNSEGTYRNSGGLELGASVLFPIVIDDSFSFVAGPRYQHWQGVMSGLDTQMLGIEAGVKYINSSNFINIYLTGNGLYDVKGRYYVKQFFGPTDSTPLNNHYDIGLKSRIIFNISDSFGLGIEGNVSRGYLQYDDYYDSYGYRTIKGGNGNYSSYSLGLNIVFHI